jgi:hypothetical protein
MRLALLHYQCLGYYTITEQIMTYIMNHTTMNMSTQYKSLLINSLLLGNIYLLCTHVITNKAVFSSYLMYYD